MRVLSVYLPAWATDLVRRRCRASDETRRDSAGSVVDRLHVLLHTTIADRQVIAHACEASQVEGVRPGMSLTHARALLAGRSVHVAAYAPQRDEETLRVLARWALRFSPVVSIDPPNGLLLNVGGCERLYRGEERLLESVRSAVMAMGFQVRCAVASTARCAWAMTRFGSVDTVPRGGERAALREIPIEGLDLDEKVIEGLHEVGIDRIEHLLALSRSELATRFGMPLLERLDQALGNGSEVLQPIRTAEPVSVETFFNGPTRSLEGIMQTVRDLTEQLTEKLKQRESGVVCLDLTADRSDAPPVHERITLSHPSRDHRHLWLLLKPRVEKLNLGFGVERLELTAKQTRRIEHEQIVRFGVADMQRVGDEQIGRLVDALGVRLGHGSIRRADLRASHLPERAFTFRDDMTVDEEKDDIPALRCPPALFDEPDPVEVIALAPDDPPSWIRWRGRAATVRAGHGPRRIAHEWWHDPDGNPNLHGTRDYYIVNDDLGRCLWVYRHHPSNSWFVHGEWA